MPVDRRDDRGNKSGKLRKTPLMRGRARRPVRRRRLASGGAPKHPVWYHNLVADPHVEVQDGPVTWDMTARVVSGDEQAEWWARVPSRRCRTTTTTQSDRGGRSGSAVPRRAPASMGWWRRLRGSGTAATMGIGTAARGRRSRRYRVRPGRRRRTVRSPRAGAARRGVEFVHHRRRRRGCRFVRGRRGEWVGVRRMSTRPSPWRDEHRGIVVGVAVTLDGCAPRSGALGHRARNVRSPGRASVDRHGWPTYRSERAATDCRPRLDRGGRGRPVDGRLARWWT